MPKPMTIELTHDANGKPFLRLKGGNGEIILSGEARSSASGARETAKRIVSAGYQGLRFVERSK